MLSDPWGVREEDFPARAALADRLRFLVRYALLAPSFRNMQPWRFQVDDSRVSVYADVSRRPLAADLHQRDLYISIGCALENLVLAAQRFGFSHELVYFPLTEEDGLVAQIRFADAALATRPDPLFRAIVQRRTHHGGYSGKPLGPTALRKLNACCGEPDLALLLTQDGPVKAAVDKLVLRASEIVFRNPRYRKEQAEARRNGAFGAADPMSGLLRIALANFGLGDDLAQHDHRVLVTSPVFGLISGRKTGREAQVRAGRVLERLYLCTTALDLCVQPLSVLLETEEVSAAFSRLFRAGGVPLLPFRLGYATRPEAPAPRRPLEEVLC
jgi:hypothetical protein